MNLSVFSPVLQGLSLEDALKFLSGLGVWQLELAVGGYPGIKHADAIELIKYPDKVKKLQDLFATHNMTISALSVHGNGVHPNSFKAKKDTEAFNAACKLARLLDVKTVVTFSGCPGDKTSSIPNWVTSSWPYEYAELLKWQWETVLIPYWQAQSRVANDSGVKVALEMHPGFCVYNPTTLLKLRQATDNCIGANFDPSHLVWQGIDIPQAIISLGTAIHFFHAKDTAINDRVKSIEGVLDTKPYDKELDRAWLFRTVGYGMVDWKATISALRLVGYDGSVSIEHEDSLMTPIEGLTKSIEYLKTIIIKDGSKTKNWW